MGQVGEDECPEADIEGGVGLLDFPEGCRAIALPVTVWAHLEALATDSKEVRRLWSIREAEAAYQIALCQGGADACAAHVEALTAPVPFFRREGVRAGAYMLGGAGAILLGGVALQLIEED